MFLLYSGGKVKKKTGGKNYFLSAYNCLNLISSHETQEVGWGRVNSQ